MIQLLAVLITGVIFLGTLAAMALRGKPEGGAEALVDAQRALDSLQTELLTLDLVSRIFATEDRDFVQAQSLPAIEALFLQERKKISLRWVGRVRKQIRLLRRLHLGSARYYARLSVKTELALAADFATLLVGCRVLQLAFALGGPYAAPGIAGAITAAAQRVCDASKESLAFLATSQGKTIPGAEA